MNLLCLDLEMNQPSGTIIQIGACIFKPKTGEIVAEFNRIIFTNEDISPDIIKLTGIKKEDVEKGSDLKTAHLDLEKFRKKNKAHKQIVTWGDGDLRILKNQVEKKYSKDKEPFCWDLGFRFFDAKTIYQSLMISKGNQIKAGLGKAMENLNLKFEGKEHNALDDAKNTAYIFCNLIWRFRK